MPSIVIGNLRALLSADTAQFDSGMRKAAESTKKFTSTQAQLTKSAAAITSAFRAMGVTLSVGALVNFGKRLMDTAEQLVAVADRTGLTTTEVQRLQYAATQSGNSLDEMTGAVGQLQNRLASGDKSVIGAVKQLGLNMAELRKLTPYDQLIAISQALRTIEDPAARAALAMDLFGRTGIAILPTLLADMKALGDEAPRMSDRTVRALEEAGDRLERFNLQIKAWAAEFFIWLGTVGERTAAGIHKSMAVILSSLATFASVVPGGDRALRMLGTSVEDLRKKSLYYNDAAKATVIALSRTGVETRRTTGAIIDLDYGTEKATKKLSKMEEEAAKLRQTMNFVGEEMMEFEAAQMKLAQERADQALADQRRLTNELEEIRIRDHEKANEEIEEQDRKLREIQNEIGEQWLREEGERLKKSSGIWQDMVGKLKGVWGTLQSSIEGSFAQMILRARTFKEAMTDIWNAIKGAAVNAFAEIAVAWVKNLAKMAIAGKTANAAGAAGTAGAAGGAAGGAGGAAGMLGGLATNPWLLAAVGGALLAKPIWNGIKSIGRGIGKLFGFGGSDKKKSFATGGFVPPGVVMPAILHGGTHGEVITPLGQGGNRAMSVNFNINALDGRDVKRVVASQVIPILKQALMLNEGDLRTSVMREVMS